MQGLDAKLKVLIIEDSPDCAVLLEHYLHQLKMIYGIKMVGSGEEGLQFLNEESEKNLQEAFLPDLIFLDLNLPGEPGLEILSKIKSLPLFSFTPVIILTASEDKEDLRETYKKGGTFFMRKPFDQSVLTETINHMFMTGVLKKRS